MGHTPTIQRASMDGSGASTVLNITDTFVFTIDYTQQMLYWIIENGFSCSNNEQHIIGYSNVDGSERSQTVVTSNCFLFGYYPRAIDFFGGDLYSFSTNTFNIYKIILGEETIVNTFDDDYISQCPASYTGMKVISDQRQQQGTKIFQSCMHTHHIKFCTAIGENPCAINNGGCAHLCLLSFSDDRNYTCSCHSGAELHPNNHDCIGMSVLLVMVHF